LKSFPDCKIEIVNVVYDGFEDETHFSAAWIEDSTLMLDCYTVSSNNS